MTNQPNDPHDDPHDDPVTSPAIDPAADPAATTAAETGTNPQPRHLHAGRPDPLDRAWRHPSELPGRQLGHGGARKPVSIGWGRITGIAIVGAMFGSVLTVLILGFSGLLSGRAKPTVRDRLLSVANDRARTDAAASVRPSMVEIVYPTSTGPARAAGFCVEHGGVILTSAVVARSEGAITVRTARGDELPATLIGSDPTSGLTLLHAEVDIPAASLATRAPSASNSVIVVGPGNAIGEGIVNATQTVAIDPLGLALPNVLLTSAVPSSMVPGSAVVDSQGKIAGVVLQGSFGVIPIDYVRQVIEQLKIQTLVSHAWVGVRTKNSATGPFISRVDPSSPAAIAGLQPGDIITKINGRTPYSTADVQALVRWRWPLDVITIVVLRGEIPVAVTMTAVAAPPKATLTTPTTPTTAGGTTTSTVATTAPTARASTPTTGSAP